MNEEIILNVETNSPYVIGAVAYVEQLENGAKITIVDKNGTTTATVYDGNDGKSISSITLNDDYTLTILYTDGDTTTTSSIRGATGASGVYYGEEEPIDPAVNVWVDPADGDGSVLKIRDEDDQWTPIESIVGEPAGFGTVTATVDANHGTPAVTVTTSGDNTAKNFAFAFSNLQPAPYDDSVLVARMDAFSALEDGSTTGDAELIDGRVGADGTTYNNIGDAIRGQVSDLKSNISVLYAEPYYSFVGFKTASVEPFHPEGGVVTLETNIGYISRSNGGVVNAGTGTWIYSDFIPIDRLDGACGRLFSHSAVANVAFYSSKDFSSYLNAYLSDSSDSISKADILAGAPEGTNYFVLCTDGSRYSLFATLTKISARTTTTITNVPMFGNRYMHISFDDTNKAFADLTANANNYDSLFDSDFFGCLKDLHDTYGCVFSCYCFYNVYTDDTKATLTFSLANATTAFKSEFEENADWLRFGLHSIDNYTYYTNVSADDAKNDWNTFINTMIDVVGLTCIDTLVRIHGFTGSKNACVGMRNALCGARGFLCSDYSETGQDKNIDTSTGYYLTNEQATVCGRMGEYYDADNSLYFYPSNWRLDNVLQADIVTWLNLFNTADRFNRSRYMIIYCHENQMTVNAGTIGVYKTKLETVLKWAEENNYIYAYPADLATK